MIFFRPLSKRNPTGSSASCLGLGQSIFTGGTAFLGIFGGFTSGAFGDGVFVFGTGAGFVKIICSGSKLIGSYDGTLPSHKTRFPLGSSSGRFLFDWLFLAVTHPGISTIGNPI